MKLTLVKERKPDSRLRMKAVGLPVRTPERNQSLLILGAFVLVTLLLNLRILFAHGIPVHGDLTYPTHLSNFLDNYLYVFNEHGSISNLESIDRAVALLPPALVAKVLGLGTDFVHKVVFLALPFLSFFSMASLTGYILDRFRPSFRMPITLISSGLLYGLSPWAMEQLQANLFWLAYALTPLMIMLALKLIERPSFRTAIWLALVMSFIASTPQYLVYSAAIVVIVGTSELAHQTKLATTVRGVLRRRVKFILAFVVLFVAFNFYWLYPVIELLLTKRSLSPGYAVEPTMTALFSSNSSPLNVLRGYDQWITWYRFDPALSFVANRFWIFNSLILPILAFMTFARSEVRQSRHIRVLAVTSLVFALFALGTTTALYDWVVFHLPIVRSFGWIFRVPGKLSYVLWVFYALMGAVLVGTLARARIARLTRIAAYAVLVFSTGILILPKAVSYFYDYYLPVTVPSDYERLSSFLSSTDIEMHRVLYLAPYDFAFGENLLQFETSYTWNPERLAAATPAISSPVPSIGYYHLTFRDWQAALYPSIYPHIPIDIGRTYLGPAGVRYLVYHNDIIGAEGRGNRDLVKLDESDLREVAVYGNIHVYENPYALPIVRTSSGAPLDVKKIDPTRYEVSLEESSQQTRLVLAQPYDASWIVRSEHDVIGPETSGPTTVEYPIPMGVKHVTVEYFPQRYYRFGLIVTLGAMLLVSIVATIRTFRRRFRKQADS